MGKNYTIGLDIGTHSVGWAVVDDQFDVIQKKRKVQTYQGSEVIASKNNRVNFWGVSLFEEGAVAEETRLKRGTRRRLKRRHERLRYLQSIFAIEMSKIDPNFFHRLDESFLWLDDKTIDPIKYPLFRTEKEEKGYYAKFPTIYHLRDYVMHHEVDDLRLIYLAMHHILKFRGNFLYQDKDDFNVDNIDISANLKALFDALIDEQNNDNLVFNSDLLDTAAEMLNNTKWSKSKKAAELKELFKQSDANHQKQVTELFKIIVGNKGTFASLFSNDTYKEVEQKDIKLSDASATEKLEKAISENGFTELEIDVLQKINAVYEATILSAILTQSTISRSMIEKYDAHAIDLKTFKAYVHETCGKQAFFDMFKANIDGNYASYVHGFDKKTKRSYATQEKFYEYVLKLLITTINHDENQNFKTNGNGYLDKVKDYLVTNSASINQKSFTVTHKNTSEKNVEVKLGDFYLEILNKIETETFLVKQRMFKNGAIPFQIHAKELRAIIKRQKNKFNFLSEVVEVGEDDNRHQAYKIETLMKFRIPYYVGPLVPATDGEIGKKVSDKSRFAWMQSSGEKITPWNFDQVVDKDASAAEFIQRMTNFDSYLPEEKVLPKNSLLYQEFTVYNELIFCGYYNEQNKRIYLDGKIRQNIVSDLFRKQKTVTRKDICSWLYNNNYTHSMDTKLFGLDSGVKTPKFNAKLSTYIDLTRIVSPEIIMDNLEFFDKIVEFQTVFEDNKILKRQILKLNKQTNCVLTDQQIKLLSKKHYTGWGRLSRKLLDGIFDRQKTIMDYLRTDDHHQNFMSLIADDNKMFKSEIEKAQVSGVDSETFCYENLVGPVVGSPAIKRGIWQSLKIVKEISDIMGYAPARIVVEMARDHETSRRSKPRLQQLKEKRAEYIQELVELDESQNLDSESVFLYYLQNGKDMYTGEALSLDDLKSCEVDHIIPQTYIKDDSIDNKVLVKRTSNQVKGGDVPSRHVIAKMRNDWQMLLDAKLISRKKFANLTKGSISERDKEGFINRQLVATRQVTKHVAQILNTYFGDNTDILTPKASLTSQFRHGVLYLNKEELSEQELQTYLENDGKIIEGKYVGINLHQGFYKVREINDYHHAHDAYLNVVVANYLYLTFPDEKAKVLIYGQHLNREERKSLGKYATTKRGNFKQFLTPMLEEKWVKLDTGEIIWDRDKALNTIAKVLSYKRINIVKKVEEQKGDFNLKVERLKKGNATVAYKKGWSVDKYGGLSSENTAFSVPVSYEKGKNKKKLVYELVPITIREKTAFEQDRYKFIANKLNPIINSDMGEIIRKNNFENINILSHPLKKYQLFEFEGGKRRLLASAKESQKGNQVPYPAEFMTFLYHAGHYDEIKYKESFDYINRHQNVFVDLLTFILEMAERYQVSNKKMNDKLKLMIENMTDYKVADLCTAVLGFANILTSGTTNLGSALKNIGGPVGDSARIRYTSSADIDIFGATLIHQSVTGLYETRIKLDKDN